jgi:hypothetical protein
VVAIVVPSSSSLSSISTGTAFPHASNRSQWRGRVLVFVVVLSFVRVLVVVVFSSSRRHCVVVAPSSTLSVFAGGRSSGVRALWSFVCSVPAVFRRPCRPLSRGLVLVLVVVVPRPHPQPCEQGLAAAIRGAVFSS